jgi:hypothetical protein
MQQLLDVVVHYRQEQEHKRLEKEEGAFDERIA